MLRIFTLTVFTVPTTLAGTFRNLIEPSLQYQAMIPAPDGTYVDGGTSAVQGRLVAFASSDININDNFFTQSFTSTGLTPPAQPVPTDKDDCKKGGWENLRRSDGSSFKNPGRLRLLRAEQQVDESVRPRACDTRG